MKTMASTFFAVVTVCTVLSCATEASAQYDHGGKVHQCVYPGSRAVHLCTLQDYNKLQQQKKAEQRRLQQQKEMESEARAYKKMQEERKRNAPTTEHCFMKNGELICKPV